MHLKPEEFFGAQGPLAKTLAHYEERTPQRELAQAVEHAIAQRHNLLAEAGTGTGKTLAYLMPAVVSGLRIVVSTATKTLQEQILNHDVPLLERALGRPIPAQLLKGRTNYLCLLHRDRQLAQGLLPGMQNYELLSQLRAWSENTNTGDRAELTTLGDNQPLWHQLTATREQCLGRRCPSYERCFVTRVRRAAQQAQIIVVNHHLYFADAVLKSRSTDASHALLPAHDLVIFDEAHELEDIASQHFGAHITERSIRDLARDISGALYEDSPRLAGIDDDFIMQSRALAPLLGEVDLRSRQLFAAFSTKGRRELLEPGYLKRFPEVEKQHALLDKLFEAIENALGQSSKDELRTLAQAVTQTAAELAWVLRLPLRPSLLNRALLPETPGELAEDCHERVIEYDSEEEPSSKPIPFVHYLEGGEHGSRAVAARPVDVAPFMSQVLRDKTALFLSATLRVGESFAHSKERLGLDAADEITVVSPFSFEEQARLFVPKDIPEPKHPDYTDKIAGTVEALIQASGGGAFILCTSLRMLAELKSRLLGNYPFPILVQGQAPKHVLLEHFRNHGNAVLIASLSFWRGVDVPGQALRLVVMDKLPFAAPDDPVAKGKMDYLQSQGKDSFRHFQLPQAALLLRQGFGRLLRRQSDRGLVSILDSRLWQRSYGRYFFKSLPPSPVFKELSEATSYLQGLNTTDTE